MTSPIGIPSTRVSDLFVRQRLLRQVQSDQAELFRVQQQVSSGKRIGIPSEDAPASSRIMSLQRLLERKEQVLLNLKTNESYMLTTDSAMGTVSGMLAEARGVALGVIDTISTQEQRDAAAQQISEVIRQLQDAGNQKFRGRYLFSGSSTDVRPFETAASGVVRYNGNETHLRSYSDIDLLFDTNLTGAEVFGAISEPVLGTAHLTPALSLSTPLSDLHHGEGVAPSSILISDGSGDAVEIDLSTARTVGDVVEMIRSEPTVGKNLHVELSRTGLNITLPGTSGLLAIREVGNGITAHELGIFNDAGVPAGTTLVGQPLDPVVQPTTQLDALFGSRARAYLYFDGMDNNITIEADANGPQYNNLQISFYDDHTVLDPGTEQVHYDPDADPPTLRININSDKSTAADVVNAINTAPGLPYTAAIDTLDGGSGSGAGFIDLGVTGQTAGGQGGDFDRTGLQIVNARQTFTFTFEDAETVQDLVNRLNTSSADLVASINDTGSGINIRSRVSGADFMIGENGGTTAQQLGVRTFTRDTQLADLNFGRGVHDDESGAAAATAKFVFSGLNNDLQIEAAAEGAQWNGFSVRFVDPGDAFTEESATYDPAAKQITFTIRSGETTAAKIVEVFEKTPGLCDDFRISLPDDGNQTNNGSGVVRVATETTAGGAAGGVDFTITRADGRVLEVDVGGLETIGELLDHINGDLQADVPVAERLVARLAANGNGIELVDNSVGPGRLTVTRSFLSTAAIDLGLVPQGEESAVGSAGFPATLTGADANPLETEGLFTALLRLEDALRNNDLLEVQRAVDLLDAHSVTMSFKRAELGAREQALEILQYRIETEEIDLEGSLSEDYDVDFAAAVSEMAARQASYQAALQSSANIFQMTLLDYL